MLIDIKQVQNILDWIKKKLFLNSIADNAKTRVVRRGEVYICDFGYGVGSEIQKERPCVIIQGNVGNINSSNVIVAPITHTNKPISTLVPIETQYNTNQTILLDGQVNLSNIQTVSKARLGNQITKLSKTDIENVNKGIYISLGLMKEIKKYEDKIKNLEKNI